MKYTAAMLLTKKGTIIFSVELGDFNTIEEAKQKIEHHKTTISFEDYNMEAIYVVRDQDDMEDNVPKSVYEDIVSNQEEDEESILMSYADDTYTHKEEVADVYNIDADDDLNAILCNFWNEYHSTPAEQQINIIKEYRTKIDTLKD